MVHCMLRGVPEIEEGRRGQFLINPGGCMIQQSTVSSSP